MRSLSVPAHLVILCIGKIALFSDDAKWAEVRKASYEREDTKIEPGIAGIDADGDQYQTEGDADRTACLSDLVHIHEGTFV